MTTRIFLIITTLLCLTFGVEAASPRFHGQGHWDRILARKKPQNQPMIKVLIIKDAPGINLEVLGRHNIYDPNTNQRVGTRFLSKGSYLEPVADGIRWGETFPGIYQLNFVPDNDEITTVINGIQYKGSTYVYQVEGKLNVVNEVLIEDYVTSILADQFGPEVPQEALSALAIAARSDACFKSINSKNPYFDVIGDKVGYHGLAPVRPQHKVAKAMQSTQHLVLSSTPAYRGGPEPMATFCLPKEFGNKKVKTNWNLDKAKELANDGRSASMILGEFFPEASIEMMNTLQKGVAHYAAGSSTDSLIADSDCEDEMTSME